MHLADPLQITGHHHDRAPAGQAAQQAPSRRAPARPAGIQRLDIGRRHAMR